MKTSFIFSVIFLLNIWLTSSFSLAYGQGSSGSLNFSYTPQQNGFSFTGTLNYKYYIWQGEPMYHFTTSFNINKSKIMYNGKWYSANEIGSDINKVELHKTFGFKVDIYQNNNKITTDNIPYARIGMAGSASWSNAITGIGADRAKTLYEEGFTVSNARINGDVSFSMFYVENRIKEIDDEKDNQIHYENAVKLADNYYNRKEYQNAISEYEKAIQFKKNEQYPKNQIAKIQEIIQKEQDEKEEKDADSDKLTETEKDDFWDLSDNNTKPAETTSKKESPDYWNLKDEKKNNKDDKNTDSDKPIVSKKDNFWDLSDNNTKPAETTSKKESPDYWNLKDEKKDNSDPFWSLNDNDDSFWSDFDNSSAAIFIIEKDPGRSGKFGVKNKLTGNLTIPYTYDHIFFVRDGIAKVALFKNKTSDKRGCSRSIEFSYYDIFFINMDNKVISDINKGLNVSTYTPLSFHVESFGETAAEREKRERERKQRIQRERECNRRQNEYINQYKQNFVRSGGELLDLK